MVICGLQEKRREVFIKLSNYQDDNAFSFQLPLDLRPECFSH